MAALNKYFVCIEYDATEGLPTEEEVPGLWAYRKVWKDNPFTRCTFGSQSVLEPAGQFMLSVGYHKHFNGATTTKHFNDMLQESLVRLTKLRALERGSEQEAKGFQTIKEQIRKDLKNRRPTLYDVDLFTDEVLDSNMGLLERFSGIFVHQDAHVRQLAAEHCGRYCERRFKEGFPASDQAAFVAHGLNLLIQDPQEPVRYAAAVATFQLEGKPVPSLDREAMVEAAREVWAAKTSEGR